MKSDGPLVSVIMPVYNAGRFLRPAVESVLGQTHRHLELIVVDDGSTDGCMDTLADLLRDARVRVIRQANAGKPSAMNRALDGARGEFFTTNDADDVSHPGRIEYLVAVAEANPEVAAVFSGYELVLDDRRVAPLSKAKGREACRADIDAFRMPSHDPTAMFRRSMVGELQFDERLPVVEGLDYILRVGERYPMMVVGEVLYGYRVHRDSITHRDPARRAELVREAIRAAARRRGEDPERVIASLGLGSGSRIERADNNLPAHFIESVLSLIGKRCRFAAMRVGSACVRLNPRDAHYWKALVYALMPVPLIKVVRDR